jgi:hypothetical protein
MGHLSIEIYCEALVAHSDDYALALRRPGHRRIFGFGFWKCKGFFSHDMTVPLVCPGCQCFFCILTNLLSSDIERPMWSAALDRRFEEEHETISGYRSPDPHPRGAKSRKTEGSVTGQE